MEFENDTLWYYGGITCRRESLYVDKWRGYKGWGKLCSTAHQKGHSLICCRVNGVKILRIKHTEMSTNQVTRTHMHHIHSFNTMSVEQCQYYITVEGTSPYRSAAFFCYPAFLGASFFSVRI